MKYKLIFDAVILKQLNKISSKKDLKKIVSKLLNKLESKEPQSGKLLDNKLKLYELKHKSPSIKIYFKLLKNDIEILVFEFEIKKNQEKQKSIIQKIKEKIKNLNLLWSIF